VSIVYTSPGFWKQLPTSSIDRKADLWVAQWEVKSPNKLANWPGWSFWQYSSKGAVPGINGNVDLNRFNGTIDDLHAYLTRFGDPGDAKPMAFDLNTILGVQRALNLLKVTVSPLVEDGLNGPKTNAAVRVFQRAHGLVVDGVVGVETRAVLNKSSGSNKSLVEVQVANSASDLNTVKQGIRARVQPISEVSQ